MLGALAAVDVTFPNSVGAESSWLTLPCRGLVVVDDTFASEWGWLRSWGSSRHWHQRGFGVQSGTGIREGAAHKKLYSTDKLINKNLVKHFTDLAHTVRVAADSCTSKKAVTDSAAAEKRWYSDLFALSGPPRAAWEPMPFSWKEMWTSDWGHATPIHKKAHPWNKASRWQESPYNKDPAPSPVTRFEGDFKWQVTASRRQRNRCNYSYFKVCMPAFSQHRCRTALSS